MNSLEIREQQYEPTIYIHRLQQRAVRMIGSHSEISVTENSALTEVKSGEILGNEGTEDSILQFGLTFHSCS